MGWHAVTGPREAGPSERESMIEKALELLAADGVEDPTRIDVPAKGTGSTDDGSNLREAVAGIIPALQSGSLFGGVPGVVLVDAQSLLKAEVDTIVELLDASDPDHTALVFVASGALPAALKKRIVGESVSIKAITQRAAATWLAQETKERGLRIGQEARTELMHRFGSDTSAMKRALDQLAVSGSTITVEEVKQFTNRPDEPTWFLTDAIMAGNQAEALRRLADFLHHQHPLVLLAYLEGEIRRRSLAAVAPDYDTFAAWAKANPKSYATQKVWDARTRANGEALSKSIKAIARADLTLKTQPEATHRVTLERLTVAMSRWMSR